MAIYKTPVRDMQFVLHELLDVTATLKELPGCEELDADTIDAILEEAGRVCEEVVVPTNRTGDQQGCRLEDGQVRVPDGFREAYHTLVEGGWFALGCEPAYHRIEAPR